MAKKAIEFKDLLGRDKEFLEYRTFIVKNTDGFKVAVRFAFTDKAFFLRNVQDANTKRDIPVIAAETIKLSELVK